MAMDTELNRFLRHGVPFRFGGGSRSRPRSGYGDRENGFADDGATTRPETLTEGLPAGSARPRRAPAGSTTEPVERTPPDQAFQDPPAS